MHPATLSHELRNARGGHLGNRRAVVALSLLAGGSMGLLLLYQMGLIKHVPEPPIRNLDGDRLASSPQAYSVGSTPDAAIGLTSLSTTILLASMDGKDRARRRPWLPIALAAATAANAAVGAFLVREQAFRYRTYCFWCLTIAASGFAALPLAIPEAREAARHLRARRREARRSAARRGRRAHTALR